MRFVMIAGLLLGTAAGAQTPAPQPDACKMLTLDEAKAAAGTPVTTGKPGTGDCTWKDAKGEDRVYLSVKDAAGFTSRRVDLQMTGHLEPVPGLAEDAFFLTSAGSSSPLFLVKHKHVVELTITGPNASRSQNQAAERATAAIVLRKL